MANNPQWPSLSPCNDPLEFAHVEQWLLKTVEAANKMVAAGQITKAQYMRRVADQVKADREDRLKRFGGYFIVPVMYNCTPDVDRVKVALGWAITWPCSEDENKQRLVSSVGLNAPSINIEEPGVDIFSSGLIASSLCRALASARIVRQSLSPEHAKFEQENCFDFNNRKEAD